MIFFRQISIALLAGCVAAGAADAPGMVTREMRTGFLPVDWVGAAMRKSLSPQGRFLVTRPTGMVRITDSPERIDTARIALQEMIVASAMVRVEIVFESVTKRTAQPQVEDRGISFPQNYAPPRIIPNGPGGFIVVPATPRDFTTRRVGAGAALESGIAAGTVTDREIARRFFATTVTGRPVAIAVRPATAETGELRALAEKFGALEAREPAWAAAGTELLVTPELSGGAMVMKVVPRIAVGAPGRPIPLTKASAGVVLTVDSPRGSGLLPGTDAEFYRVFLGTPPAEADALMAVTVAAHVQYIGDPPK